MVVLVVLLPCLLLAAAVAKSNPSSTVCEQVRQEFVLRQAKKLQHAPTVTPHPSDAPICRQGSPCCSKDLEATFRGSARKDFQSMVAESASGIRDYVDSNLVNFNDMIRHHILLSHNRTLRLFTDVYRRIDVSVPIAELHHNLESYISGANVDIEGSVQSLFDAMFPEIYHHILHPKLASLSPEYKACLAANAQKSVKPFREVPSLVAKQMHRSVRVTRHLLDALNLTVRVMNYTTSRAPNPSCVESLVRLTYCARCEGLMNVQPCRPFCQNVIRGCLATLTSTLDEPWTKFVVTLEKMTARMVGMYDFEQVLSSLQNKISESVMLAMESGPDVTKRVIAICGHPSPLSGVAPTLKHEITRVSPSPKLESILPKVQQVVGRLVPGYFGGLADSLCDVQVGTHCWNGHEKSEYQKPLVSDDLRQKNPEVEVTPEENDVVLKSLREHLVHLTREMKSSLVDPPVAQSYTGEGSGWWTRDDEDYDGSGSGDWPPETRYPNRETDFNFETQPDGRNRDVTIEAPDSSGISWKPLNLVELLVIAMTSLRITL